MKEKSLLYISIVCSLIGLALLYFISQKIELKQTPINQINPDDTGKNVRLCGDITSKYVSKNKHVFFKLQDQTGEMNIVVFNNTAKNINAYQLETNDTVCVIGSVDEYQNKLEIILQKIEGVLILPVILFYSGLVL
jgi:DNA/RNA endonuclease YhcR with UshA esterase domain